MKIPNEAEPFEPSETSVFDRWLPMLRRHKSLLALGTVVGLALGALAHAQRTPVYQSTAQLIVTKKQGNPLSNDADPRNYFYEDYLATHQILIRSSVVVHRAAQKERVRLLHAFQGSPDPAGAIRASLAVLRDSKDPTGPSNNVLNLAYSCTDAADSATVLEAVIDSYKDYLEEKFKFVSEDTLQQVVRALKSMQTRLDEKKEAYEKFKEASPLIYAIGKDGGTLEEDRLGHIEGKRLTLMLQRAEIQGRLDGITSALREGRGRQALLAQLTASLSRQQGSSREGEPKVHEQLHEMMLKEQVLLADFGPDHPEVMSVRKRIAMTREFFAQGAGGGPGDDPVQWHIQALRQQRDDIDHSLASLGQMSETEEKKVRNILKYKSKARQFQMEIAALEQQNAPIADRLRQVNFISDLGGFNVQVIEPPSFGRRTGTGAVQIIVLGGVLGLMAGFGLAFLAETADKSFRTPEEIRRRLGLPVVGHIPQLRPDAATLKQLATGQTCLDPMLCTLHRPKSPQAEAFRGVRTALYFSTQGEVHQIIQVTSPSASDGKSTLAANLAICIAQSGKKIVLLDADFRKPRQHKIFGATAKKGLASVVAGEVEWKDAVQPTSVPGLFLLPCGGHPENPAELLTSDRFKELLDVLREQYEYVIVDTPPLLAVSDPSAVAPRVDGVLLAVRVSKNARPNAERAREILMNLGARIFGVVVIGTSPDGQTDSYGGYYYYSNYQEDGDYYPDTENADPNAPAPRPRQPRPEKNRTHMADSDPKGLWQKWRPW